MSREGWLGLYVKLTGLVEKLPGGLQKPILRELVPIRQMFLEMRPARLVLLGPAGRSFPDLFHAAVGGQALHTGSSDNGWRTYQVPGRGSLEVLDARDDVPASLVEAGSARFSPDLLLVVADLNEATDLGPSAARVSRFESEIPLAGVAFGGSSACSWLAGLLSSEKTFSSRKSIVFDGEGGQTFAEEVCRLLPNPAKLEFARLTGARKAQAEIAGSLLKSFTAVCGVIAVQPIPLADMPILITLQTLMVALIIHTTGRKATARLALEFVAALGLNVGAGLLFREGARALLKVVPFWGHAVSGVVAGAGTYAIGRAAIAYFIEETPIAETRKIFHRFLPKRREALPDRLDPPPNS